MTHHTAWSRTWRIEKVELATQGFKRCTVCLAVKCLAAFNVNRAAPDNLATRCKPCVNAHRDNWKREHPDHFRKWTARNKERRHTYTKHWRESNQQHVKESYSQWAKSNPDKVNAIIARRNAAKRQATPVWADQVAIQAFYREASRLTRETGTRHEVDHIVPLVSRIVCGLHVEHNLQILTSFENKRKRNHHEALLAGAFNTPDSNALSRTASLNCRTFDLPGG